MKTCIDCKHADWMRTVSGRLHPSGGGSCTKDVVQPPLPASKFWISTPIPCGGYINRRRELKEHCVYWERKKS